MENFFRPGTGKGEGSPLVLPLHCPPENPGPAKLVQAKGQPNSTPHHTQAYGWDPASGLWLPQRIDPATGRLLVDAGITFTGEVKIGAVEIEDRTGGATLRVDVVPIGSTSSPTDNNHGFLSMGVDDSGKARALPIEELGTGSGSYSIPVTIKSNTGDAIDKYGEAAAVTSADGETLLVSQFVPAGRILWLRHVSVSGGNVAIYRIKTASTIGGIVTGTIKDKRRTYFTRFNEDFLFGGDVGQGMKLTGPLHVGVTAEHNRPGTGPAASISASADFNATIYGREEAAL